MRRRDLLRAGAAAVLPTGLRAGQRAPGCDCSFQVQAAAPGPFERVGSRLRVTGMNIFGVSLTRSSDRPYVFFKLETNQGIVGWGEGTLEGKAGAAMACINDFREFVIGADPMQVEHIWQSMYVHSFYRAGPVMGSAMSGIDQALWDIRGKALGVPVYKLLGGPLDPRGVRGYYHADGVRTPEELREAAGDGHPAGRFVLQNRHSRLLRVDRDAKKICGAVEAHRRCCGRRSALTSTSRWTFTRRPAPASPPSSSRKSSR